MTTAKMTSKSWTLKAGGRAWWNDRNCDVKRIFQNGRVRIQYWGSGLLDGKRVTQNVHADSLSAPSDPILEECSECCGSGEAQATCCNCGVGLTTHNVGEDPESEACRECEVGDA